MKLGTMIDVGFLFTEPLLGTSSKNPKPYKDFILGRAVKAMLKEQFEKKGLPVPDLNKAIEDDEEFSQELAEVSIATTGKALSPEEIDSYEDPKAVEDRGTTIFLKDENGIYVYNYWFRGFIKSATQALQETEDVSKITAYKSRIDRFVFARPRKLYFTLPEGVDPKKPLEVLERPLRGMTPKGARVTLARSEMLPAGTRLDFQIELLKNKGFDVDTLRELLEYGRYEGLGQWRSGGYGTFDVTKFEVRE